jgi:hypothetical protein
MSKDDRPSPVEMLRAWEPLLEKLQSEGKISGPFTVRLHESDLNPSGPLFNQEDVRRCIVSDLPPCPSCGSEKTMGLATSGQAVLSCLDCGKAWSGKPPKRP